MYGHLRRTFARAKPLIGLASEAGAIVLIYARRWQQHGRQSFEARKPRHHAAFAVIPFAAYAMGNYG